MKHLNDKKYNSYFNSLFQEVLDAAIAKFNVNNH